MLLRNAHKSTAVKYSLLWILVTLPYIAYADRERGKSLYQPCAACHLATGKGVPGMFPPITQRLGMLAAKPKGRDYLVMLVQAGMMGSIVVEGVHYRGYMPAQGLGMSDEDIASVINYVLDTFNAETLDKNWQLFSPSEVSAIKARYPDANGQQVYVMRQLVFDRE